MVKFLSWLRRAPPLELSAIPTVRFDARSISREIKDLLKADIAALPEIPTQLRRAAYRAALESVSRGRDLSYLDRWLIEQSIPGLGGIEAARISRWINNRATTRIRIARETKHGIGEGVWVSSGAPCQKPGENPAEAHRAAHGRRFTLTVGMMIDGEPTWPGMEEGCRCTWRAIVPGFD